MQFRALGDNALTVTPDRSVDPATLADALLHSPPAGVTDAVAAFDSVTILYDATALPRRVDPIHFLRHWIETVLPTAVDRRATTVRRTIDVPVDYGGDDGPDLYDLAESIGMTPRQVIDLHAGGVYIVAAVGFLPGFAYLTGLAPRLRVPRRATPRVSVPAGSVAVGGPYTGVYPVASPGGWHLIGRTRVGLFDPTNPMATPFRVGDAVRFVPRTGAGR